MQPLALASHVGVRCWEPCAEQCLCMGVLCTCSGKERGVVKSWSSPARHFDELAPCLCEWSFTISK